MFPQLSMKGRVIHFHARIHDISRSCTFADVAFAPRNPSKKEDWGSVQVFMDIRFNGWTTYTVVMLSKPICRDERSCGQWFNMLREVTLPPEGKEWGESSGVQTLCDITHCVIFERVGALKVTSCPGRKQFEELGWSTQAQREDIIIC